MTGDLSDCQAVFQPGLGKPDCCSGCRIGPNPGSAYQAIYLMPVRWTVSFTGANAVPGALSPNRCGHC